MSPPARRWPRRPRPDQPAARRPVNFALPAITLLLLLLPGILAVQGFLGRIGRKTSDPVGQAGLTWAGLVALLIAPGIHLLLIGALHLFQARPPDLHATLVL